MRTKNEQIVPIAFWLGFLALGLATGLAGSAKHAGPKNVSAKAQTVGSPAVSKSASYKSPNQNRAVLARD